MLCMTRHHLFNPVACKCFYGEPPERTVFAPVARGSTRPSGFIIRDHVAFRSYRTESMALGWGGWHALLGSLAQDDASGFLLF